MAAAARGARALPGERWALRWMAVVTWGLTAHILAVALLFGFVGLPVEVVRLVAVWKEALVVALFAWVLARGVAGHGPRLHVGTADVAVLALVALTVGHALASVAGIGMPATVQSIAFGTRDLVFFVALYLVGRCTPVVATEPAVLRRLLVVGAVTGAVAFVEWLVVTPELLVLMGIASYFNDFLGVSAFTDQNVYGLPGNYWTMIGSRAVQRAGSVYMSSQGFAVTFLVILPAATVWIGLRRKWGSPLVLAAYALAWAGLLLSVTRMTILACLVQTLLIIVLLGRPAPLVGLGVAGAATAGVLLLTVTALPAFVWETITWQSGSSQSHSKDYVNGLAALWERPLGSGLGTTDMTAVRLGREFLTADNQFLKYAVELGVAGLAALVVLVGALLWQGTRGAVSARTPELRAAGMLLAAMTTGFVVNGMTAVLTNSPTFTYLYFWFAGAAVTALGAERGAGAPLSVRPPPAAGPR